MLGNSDTIYIWKLVNDLREGDKEHDVSFSISAETWVNWFSLNTVASKREAGSWADKWMLTVILANKDSDFSELNFGIIVNWKFSRLSSSLYMSLNWVSGAPPMTSRQPFSRYLSSVQLSGGVSEVQVCPFLDVISPFLVHLPLFLLHGTMPWRMVFPKPDVLVTWPIYHFSFLFLTVLWKSSRPPMVWQ